MFTWPFYFPYYAYNLFRPANSYVRLLHASPDAPAVDIYANNYPVARNLSYRGFTEYMAVAPGNYNVTVYPAGQKSNPLLSTSVDIPEQAILTIAAVGMSSALGVLTIPDPVMSIPQGKLMLRFVHLSPNAPRVDVALPNGTMLFRDIAYEQVANYIPLDPGVYVFQLKETGSDQVILHVPNINLRAGKFYTIYAVGLAGATPPLQVLIPLDGNTYIKL